jgi:hypothetical protein
MSSTSTKQPRKLPNLREQINEQHITLLPFRDWQPIASWVYTEQTMPYPDHHWLNVCRAEGFEAAMRRLYMTAALHATYASTLVRTFWGIYTGGGLLPGTKHDCKPEHALAVSGLGRVLGIDRFETVVKEIDRHNLSFPVRLWGLQIDTLDQLDEILKTRREAIAHYPDPLAADSLMLINLLPSQLKKQQP